MDNPYRDETPMTGDYISNDIRTIAEAIRHKKYGVATRDAMAQSLEKMGRLAMQSVTDPNSVAKQAYDVAYNADSRSIANSSRLDNIVTPPKSDSSTEVTDARVGATSLGGVTYHNLGNSIRGQIDTLNGKVISADTIKLNADRKSVV